MEKIVTSKRIKHEENTIQSSSDFWDFEIIRSGQKFRRNHSREWYFTLNILPLAQEIWGLRSQRFEANKRA